MKHVLTEHVIVEKRSSLELTQYY